MKSFITGLIIGGILCGAAVWRFHGPPEEEKDANKEEAVKDHVEHEKDGTTSIKLEEEEQKQMGLRVAQVKEAKLTTETKAYGRVLNAAELPLMLAEISVAEVALKGSKLAYDRLKRLNGEAGTVSEQKVEEANEAMRKDEVALQTAHVKLTSAWGQAVAKRPDIESLAKQIAANEVALIRLDLQPGEGLGAAKARVALPGSEDHPVNVEILGPAPAADPVTQSASLICLVNAKAWVPGAAVIGWLSGEDKGDAVISVPRSALLRHEGMVFVYHKHDDEYKRVPVELSRAQGDSWLVKGELKVDDEVVVTGAQQLLAEELKGPAED